MAQHLSVRVPWKDNGYNGFVCNKPCYNNSCLRLKNISGNRDDALEEKLSGCPIKGHSIPINQARISHTHTSWRRHWSIRRSHFLPDRSVGRCSEKEAKTVLGI